MKHSFDKILVIDFGSQYTQLIARKIREQNVFAILKPSEVRLDEIISENPKGIILSGGPKSVYDADAPMISPEIFNLNLPILGICYGFQLMSQILGGKVERAEKREFGLAKLHVIDHGTIFSGLRDEFNVWMSHSDKITKLPNKFKVLARTENSEYASVISEDGKLIGVQFHPEVAHTEFSKEIFKNFLFNICRCEPNWIPQKFIESKVEEIRGIIGDKKIICALSGGVDSTVAAVLVQKAVGKNLICMHVDTGLMRKDESKNVMNLFTKNLNLNVHFVDAHEKFLSKLKGVVNPEEKRKIVGEVFIRAFEEEVEKLGDIEFLVQGTLYPDVVESGAFSKNSSKIKTHHNVGGLPDHHGFTIIEPLRELFKDEVRKIGYELNIPKDFLDRHPFPGPGLAVRIIGEVTEEKLNIIREADYIFIEELKRNNLYDSVWQAFAVLLPIRSVGVMGDERSYEYTIVLRAVASIDGMTADWAKLDLEFLNIVSNKIINEIKGVNRVVYDITSKPPATIEWE